MQHQINTVQDTITDTATAAFVLMLATGIIDYEPILQVLCYAIGIVVGALRLANLSVDTYRRYKRWRAKKRD